MTKIHELPTHSGIILSLGSGGENVKKQLMAWKKIPGENTSRAIFMAHCDALLSEEEKVRIIDSDGDKISFERDIFSGGAPQLVSLYRVGNANIHGIVWKRKKFLNGIAGKYFLPTLNWRDRKFQNCDPLSLKPKTDAKLHRHEITIRKRMT